MLVKVDDVVSWLKVNLTPINPDWFTPLIYMDKSLGGYHWTEQTGIATMKVQANVEKGALIWGTTSKSLWFAVLWPIQRRENNITSLAMSANKCYHCDLLSDIEGSPLLWGTYQRWHIFVVLWTLSNLDLDTPKSVQFKITFFCKAMYRCSQDRNYNFAACFKWYDSKSGANGSSRGKEG